MLNKNFIFAVLSATIGSGFQHGYHTGVINVPQKLLQDWIQSVQTNRTGIAPGEKYMTFIWSSTVAMFPAGGALGGCLTACFCDNFGRKKSLIFNNFIVLAGILFLDFAKLAKSFELFMAGRFLVGVNAGLNGGLCQIYLIEIAPVDIRGAVGSVYQLMITISILTSQICGLFMGTEHLWPYIFLVAIAPACFQLLTLPFCPESPKYLLVNREKDGEAAKALAWLRNTSDVSRELEELKTEDGLLTELHPVSCKRMFADTAHRNALSICAVLMVGQQFCGINAVIYFSTETFRNVGIEGLTATYSTIGVGLLNVLATGVALLLIDLVGRKLLLLVGFVGMAIDTILMTVALILLKREMDIEAMKYLCVLFVFLFVLLFAPGIGTVPWFITAEVFHHRARALAVSLTVPANWIANFIVGQTFLPLESVIGYYVFTVFVVLDLFFYCYIKLYLPETTQKSAKEIIGYYHSEFLE